MEEDYDGKKQKPRKEIKRSRKTRMKFRRRKLKENFKEKRK